jgi:prolyl oligopeptidase
MPDLQVLGKMPVSESESAIHRIVYRPTLPRSSNPRMMQAMSSPVFPRVLLVILTAGLAAAAPVAPAPETPKRPVTEVFHGQNVIDDYQWLEDAKSPEVQAWVTAQNARTRAFLDALPDRNAIMKALAGINSRVSANYGSMRGGSGGLVSRGGRIFTFKNQPPKQQPLIVSLATNADPRTERVVLDPNLRSKTGSTSIDWFVPSNDGRTLAVCLSDKGSEQGSLVFIDVATGRQRAEKLERVQFPTGGGSAAFDARNEGVFYTRYPSPGERPAEDLQFFQQIFYHRFGTAQTADTYVLGKDFPRIAECVLESSDDGSRVVLTVANGDGGEFMHYLRMVDGNWTKLTDFSDKVKTAHVGRDGDLYLLSQQDAPRGKILRLDPDSIQAGSKPNLANAPVVVPQGDGVIEEYRALASKLYVSEMLGGPSRLRVFELGGGNPQVVPSPEIATIDGLAGVDGHADDILFRQVTFTEPSTWYRYDPTAAESDRLVATKLRTVSPVSFDDIEVVREFATSKDGTRVPLNILKKKGVALDGQNPTILYGYGGYGINMSPSFVLNRHIWLANGGIFVIANLRGGGEFGDDWHLSGNLTRKQNVFDDFIACARHLISRGYTSPAKLSIQGGSNGGLLMGAALTQAPELFRAVVAHVGIYDMLRVELDANGAFNVTEFGTVKDAAQFQALYAYSPYHHVKDGVKYPAVFFLAGEHDGRVNPANSRKMTARLQAATASEWPVLLRVSSASGHGIGTALNEQIAQQADVYAFLFDQLGMTFTAPAEPKGKPRKKKGFGVELKLKLGR